MQVLLSSPREKLAFGRLFIHHRCFSFSFFLFALVRIRKTRFQDRLTGTKGRNGRKQEGIKVGGARKDLPCAASICMEIWDDWSLPVFPKSLLFCIVLLQYAASRIALLFPTRNRGEIDLPFASKEAPLVNRSFNIIRGLRKSRSFKLERKKKQIKKSRQCRIVSCARSLNAASPSLLSPLWRFEWVHYATNWYPSRADFLLSSSVLWMPLNTVDEQFISRSSRYRLSGGSRRGTRPKAVWAKRRQWSASRYAVHVAHVHQRGRFCTPVTQMPVKSVSLSYCSSRPL